MATYAASLSAGNSFKPLTEVVRTAQGSIRGRTNGGVDQFLGIPYAAPPTGDLRWKAPAKPAAWSGVRDASQPGGACVQMGRGISRRSIAGSEDCLYLNIYRPAHANPVQPLPVLLFIHGGSNQRGSGNEYDPSEMVVKTGIIVVTINYRLNVFGFLALPSLDAEAGEASSGNFGLLDQQAAMRWVHDNIKAFGGDPRNVTIDGESAGGIDVCAHLASPAAAGLFTRAILESAYCPTASHDEAIRVSAPVATAVGCTDFLTTAACMRAKAAAGVLTAARPLSVAPGGGKGFNASPNFGNRLLPSQPAEAFSSGKWNQSPILLGSNHDENALFMAPALIAHHARLPLSPQAYKLIVAAKFGPFAPAVLNEYPLDQYPSPFLAYSGLTTDRGPLGCPVTGLSQSFAAMTQTFRYEFNDPSAPVASFGFINRAGISLGAYHGSELQYLFKMTRLPGPQTAAQRRLSDQMMQYWANFAKTGDPNGPGLVAWPPYDTTTHQVLSLKPEGSTVIDNFDVDHHCAFWAAAPGPAVR